MEIYFVIPEILPQELHLLSNPYDFSFQGVEASFDVFFKSIEACRERLDFKFRSGLLKSALDHQCQVVDCESLLSFLHDFILGGGQEASRWDILPPSASHSFL